MLKFEHKLVEWGLSDKGEVILSETIVRVQGADSKFLWLNIITGQDKLPFLRHLLHAQKHMKFSRKD